MHEEVSRFFGIKSANGERMKEREKRQDTESNHRAIVLQWLVL